jgi:hypothetical protein
MAYPRHKPIAAPKQVAFAQTEDEQYQNDLILCPIRYLDDEEGCELEEPVVDPYSIRFEVTLNFKCDDTLRDWIDAIGFAHRLSRSECIRRLVMLGIARLEGEFVVVPEQLSLVPLEAA